MTFREKIKSFLHHSSSHKKRISNASASSPTSAAAPTAAKPDPNKPPNARDPGFRKSFNLGDPPTSSSNGSTKTEPRDIGSSNSQNIAVNGHATGSHMYTLDKYGDDYLAVSPRTNVTVPEGNLANRGLATCSPLDADESAKANQGLGTIQEQKPKDDPVVAAAKTLDTLPTPQKSPDFGREQFAHGDRKDSGFVEPVPTRDSTVSSNSKPEHPAALDLEYTPPASSVAPECQEIEAANTTSPVSNHIRPIAGSPEAKYSSLLVPHAVEDGASSVYSDDSTRPTLQQIASSDYGPLFESPELKATSPAPQNTTAVDHQRRYSLLVSEELPTVEEGDNQQNGAPVEEKEPLPAIDENADLLTVVRRSLGDSSAAGDISPSVLPADETNTWSQDLIANIDKIQNEKEQRDAEKAVANGMNDEIIPDTAVTLQLDNPKESVDTQATSLVDAIRAHVQPPKQTEEAPTFHPQINQQIIPPAPADIAIGHVDFIMPRNQESEDSKIQSPPSIPPANQKPIITTTNTVPHADAFHMGDNIPDVPVIDGKWPAVHPLPKLLPPSKKLIVTTTNTIPHADAYNMGDDIPDVPVIEGKSPIVTTTNTVPHVKVIPNKGDGSEDDDIPKLSFNESIYANRDKIQYDSALLGLKEKPVGEEDSVYAVTKEIPGAF
ncbi:hypothetical protein TWF506_011201 [Arthrobotrys conoides]|uniref:Uncharacterized protein n=1 Tax=Arthrobotrys conoides TaxID=74498 RepID=A0AAN8RKE2_9PEZI